jgi:hypothetical protein
VYTGSDYQPLRSGDEKSKLYSAVLSIETVEKYFVSRQAKKNGMVAARGWLFVVVVSGKNIF